MSSKKIIFHRENIENTFKNIRQKTIPSVKLPRLGFKPVMPEHTLSGNYGTDAVSLFLLAVSLVLIIASRYLPEKGIIKPAALFVALVFAGKDAFLTLIDSVFAGRYFCEESVFVFTSFITFIFGNFLDGAMIMLAYRCTRLTEALSIRKLSSVSEWLNIELPKRSTVETKTGLKTVSPSKIKKGRHVIVPSNGIIPVDGVVLEGESRMNTYPVTGSEQTVGISRGSRVFSGCVNGENEITIKAEADFDRSTACVINSMLISGVGYSAERNRLIDYWSHLFATCCLWAGSILAVVPRFFIKTDWNVWIGKGCAVIALSMFCILSRAVYVSFAAGVAHCAAKGINVGGCRTLEKLTALSAVIFNKTGTLTENRFEIEEICAKTMDEYELLAVAAVAEQFSEHPIAKSICTECPSFEHMDRGEVGFEEIAGRGVSVGVRGRHILVGNAGLLEECGIKCDIPRRGNISVHVAVDGKYCGYIVMTNKLRENSFDTIEALRRFKINNFVILTGDLNSAARPVQQTLNIDLLKAELKKEEKLSAIEYLKSSEVNEKYVAYVCTGCEDEEFFTNADVGVSIGALGCKGALDSADVLIMADDMKLFPKALEYAESAGRNAYIETAVYCAVKLLLLILSITGISSVAFALSADIALGVILTLFSFLLIKIRD